VTLATFAEVPWNAPHYLRCGFRAVGDADVTPGLRAIPQREDVVLHQWPSGECMRRDPEFRDPAMPS